MSQATLAQENWTGNQQVSLLDLLDRLLEKGVVVDGEILLTVADIDLVHLGLKCVLASVETLEKNPSGNPPRPRSLDASECLDCSRESLGEAGELLITPHPSLSPTGGEGGGEGAETGHEFVQRSSRSQEDSFFKSAPAKEACADPQPRSKINVDAEKVEKGLVKLVLTVVELLRKLMERQAIRRMEGGSLRPRKMEELGLAFLRLDEKMQELKKFFGLKDEDLNLSLGPLGNLM